MTSFWDYRLPVLKLAKIIIGLSTHLIRYDRRWKPHIFQMESSAVQPNVAFSPHLLITLRLPELREMSRENSGKWGWWKTPQFVVILLIYCHRVNCELSVKRNVLRVLFVSLFCLQWLIHHPQPFLYRLCFSFFVHINHRSSEHVQFLTAVRRFLWEIRLAFFVHSLHRNFKPSLRTLSL